jgi:hypothetical protein
MLEITSLAYNENKVFAVGSLAIIKKAVIETDCYITLIIPSGNKPNGKQKAYFD